MFILSVSENILLFVSGIGITQAVLLALLLVFYHKSDRSVNIFLAFFIAAVTVPMLMAVVPYLFSWQVIIFLEPFTLLGGPLLLLYVRSFKEVITWRKALPHLVMFLLFVPFAFVVYDQVGSQYPPSDTVPPQVTKHPLSFIPVTIRLLQRVVYYFFARHALLSYQRSIRHLFSETSRISLGWVKWLVNGYLLIVFTTIVMYSLILKYPEYFNWWVLSNGLIVSVYIYMATVKGLAQPTIWQIRPDMPKEKLEEEMLEAEERLAMKGKMKSRTRPAMQDSKTGEIVVRINAAMEQDKLYQEPELTLQNLADKLNFPSYQVSQAINDGMKKNFYDLVNSYRVEEAKRLLLDSKNRNYTILSVGFEAGFNSKTTFNTVFKKFTGLTPTDFRDKERL
jgi:AraC-like DNA-binding protein